MAVVNMQTAVMTADHLPSVAESASGLMGLGEYALILKVKKVFFAFLCLN